MVLGRSEAVSRVAVHCSGRVSHVYDETSGFIYHHAGTREKLLPSAISRDVTDCVPNAGGRPVRSCEGRHEFSPRNLQPSVG